MSTASGILANVFPAAMADVVDPPRCIATVRLPCQVITWLLAMLLHSILLLSLSEKLLLHNVLSSGCFLSR